MNGEKLVDLLSKLKLTFRKLLIFLMYHLRYWYSSIIIYEQNLAGGTTIPLIDTEIEVSVRCASFNDIEKMFQVNIDKKKISKRLEHGHICFVSVRGDGKIVGYCWVAYEGIHLNEIDRKLELSPEEAMIYDCFVYEEYRKRRVYQRMLGTVCIFIRDKGFQRVYIHSVSTNIPSNKGIKKVGFKEKGRVSTLKFFGLKKYREKWKGAKLCFQG